MNLSLAAASERLRDMEATGGVSLLDRRRRGVTPTRSGEALAHHARLVLRQVGAMQVELSEHARGIRGSVGIVPECAARRARRIVPLAIVRLSNSWATRRLVLCCRSQAELDPMARRLMTHLSLWPKSPTA